MTLPVRPLIILASLSLAMACDSPNGTTDAPQESQGTFYHGDEAVAIMKQWLAESMLQRRLLHGPQGARLAASRGMTLERARAANAEAIAYYGRNVFEMSPAGAIARLDGQLREAKEDLMLLQGPQGMQVAADRGVALERAVADAKDLIVAIERNLEARREALHEPDAAADDYDCAEPALMSSAHVGLEWPDHDENANVTRASMRASHLSQGKARQEIMPILTVDGEVVGIGDGRPVASDGCETFAPDAPSALSHPGAAVVCAHASSCHFAETDHPDYGFDGAVDRDTKCRTGAEDIEDPENVIPH